MASASRPRNSRLPVAVLVVVAGSLGVAPAGPVAPPAQARLVGPVSLFLTRSLQIAFENAARKLSDEGCMNALAEFSDSQGRSLAEVLAATGQTGREYLSQLFFFDGTATRPCQNNASLAWTSPGSRAIFLCGQRFAQIARRDPDLASFILIHEEFHSLGLGENPPSSAEITFRIASRCR
jgi:hypothetical protein